MEEGQIIAFLEGKEPPGGQYPFYPGRILLQDFTGVPAVVDLAAMRSAMRRTGKDPSVINPLVPVNLVVDHSIQVDFFGSSTALTENMKLEYDRNGERYSFLKWGQKSFQNFHVTPPGTGIVHQVNLEVLSRLVLENENVLYPDSLVGTDSHTTMISGAGILAWGVGGIEAESAMLGTGIPMGPPLVTGMKLTGSLKPGVTATDLVLTITQILRKKGVVGRFVEFTGPGVSNLGLADRATISNMSPEYGATTGLFPVDEETLQYYLLTGRDKDHVDMIRKYYKAMELFHTANEEEIQYEEMVELDLGSVESSLAGPKRPQDRIPMREMKESWKRTLHAPVKEGGFGEGETIPAINPALPLTHGSVVLAAITSCTNTSNPGVLVAAGILARNAVRAGLRVPEQVKTSFAPGSRSVTIYLEKAGLLESLETLGFHIVGYGCTTCIGNSGPLPDPVRKEIEEKKLVVAGVLSGNRNFEGRINPHIKANYLASPPLVVAFALAGRVDINLDTEPLGKDPSGKDVFLKDLWPTGEEIREVITASVTPESFASAMEGDQVTNDLWSQTEGKESSVYDWNGDSTYVREPDFFQDFPVELPPVHPIEKARALLVLGDSVTTDHISPAGSIPPDSPAAKYLQAHGVERKDFNSFGSRRGNHEVMVRGTFGNIRIRNRLLDGKEGGYTLYLPNMEEMSVFDAAEKYRADQTPLVVLAGKEYGTGSSRDWAAKGTMMLGVRAVIAESFERIHRSNLAGMGILPLEFINGESVTSLGLSGKESFTIHGVDTSLTPGATLRVETDGNKEFQVKCRLDNAMELEWFFHGGVLNRVLRNFITGKKN